MISSKYALLVIFNAKKGKENELKESLLYLVTETLQEDGCLNFDLHQSEVNPLQFMIYENWTSKDTHAQHDKSPHVLKWREHKHEMLDGSTVASVWKYIN